MPLSLSPQLISTSIAATASFVLSPLCCRVAPIIGALDVPRDKRRMHSRPTPRAGGLALFPAIFIALIFLGSELTLPMLIGSSLIFAAGIADDILCLSPSKKLFAQALAAALTLISGGELLIPDVSYAPFAFIWIVLITNSFNLIDGLDGLCTGISIASFVAVFLIGGYAEAAVVAAALLGFLPQNRHPAKTFLGDSGAMLSGFLASVISLPILFGGANRAFSIAVVFALPIFDTLIAFLRRILSGHSPFRPDRKHLHHRLVDSGLSHPDASRLMVMLSAALGFIGLLISVTGLSAATVICTGLLTSACGCTALCCLTPRSS